MKVKKAVIPAAGLGTRMLPATKTVPKELLPLAEKPSIQYIVEECVAAGIEDILIITNRMKTAMDDYFDYHPELEEHLRRTGRGEEADMLRKIADAANIVYVRQKETRGLGHAIMCARSFAAGDPFAVLLGDDVMLAEKPVIGQLIQVAAANDCSTVGMQQVSPEAIGKYCSLKLEPMYENVHRVLDIVEKPRPEQVFSLFAILGRYVLTSDVFEILDRQPPGYGGEIQLTDALAVMARREKMAAVDFEGRRFDTGSLNGYLEAVIETALRHPTAGPWLRDYMRKRLETL